MYGNFGVQFAVNAKVCTISIATSACEFNLFSAYPLDFQPKINALQRIRVCRRVCIKKCHQVNSERIKKRADHIQGCSIHVLRYRTKEHRIKEALQELTFLSFFISFNNLGFLSFCAFHNIIITINKCMIMSVGSCDALFLLNSSEDCEFARCDLHIRFQTNKQTNI